MKILVTGAAGYLGSVLTGKLLEKGHEVVGLDALMFGGESLLPFVSHPHFSLVVGDVRSRELVEEVIEGVSVVFHLAALVGEPACKVDENLTKEINFEASVQLADVARAAGVGRFIFSSTCSNYGISDATTLAVETDLLKPLSLYAETKIDTENTLLSLSSEDFGVTILRLATIFGLSGRMRFNLLINEMVRDAFVGQQILLYKEDAWRPYTHTIDAANALYAIMEADRKKVTGEVFNVGTENLQKKQLVDLVREIFPDMKVEKKGGTPDNRDYKVSFEKIKNTIGFVPQKTVKEGISEIFDALQKNMFSNPNDERYSSWINTSVLKNI